MAERPKHNLPLPEADLNASFLQEWRALFDCKPSDLPTLERQPRGNWRLIPKSVSAAVSSLSRRGAMVCPSADMFLTRIRSFLGVLTNLPPEGGGIAWEAPLTANPGLVRPSSGARVFAPMDNEPV
jgi:hypothetical protein